MKIGSDEHKQRFCNAFIASHCRFDPERLAWPDLDAAALERLRGIPFWQEVLYTERRAGAIVAAYAATIADPLVREAVTLQGLEEARHAEPVRFLAGAFIRDFRRADARGNTSYRIFYQLDGLARSGRGPGRPVAAGSHC